MSDGRPLNKSDILNICPEAEMYKGLLTVDANDAPNGIFMVRKDSMVANIPVEKDGIFECVGGGIKKQTFTTDGKVNKQMFVRTRWYRNDWGAWDEIATSPVTTLANSRGGGKRLLLNALRIYTERRCA